MKKQQRYTTEFGAEAVKLVTEQGLSQETAANPLGVPKGKLGNVVAAAKTATRSTLPEARSAADLEAEVVRLRKVHTFGTHRTSDPAPRTTTAGNGIEPGCPFAAD